MNYTIFPQRMSKSSNEILTEKLNQEYWNYIKLYFKYKLKYKPITTDYNHTICIDYKEYGFWFRITKNYKIEAIHNKCDEEFMKKRLEEIKNIIKIYYPNIY